MRLSNIRGLAPTVELFGAMAAGRGEERFSGGARIALAAAEIEVKGGLARALRLEATLAGGEGGFFGGVSARLLEVPQLMLGSRRGGGLCLPGLVIFGGDCRADSGLAFLSLSLLEGAKDLRSSHGGVRWASLGVGLDVASRRFDVNFFRLRLPLELGIDISSVHSAVEGRWRWALARPYLRVAPVWRSTSLRWSLAAEGALRPRVDAFTDDLHAYGALRVSWLGTPRLTYNAGNLLRVYVLLRYDYRSRPAYALAPSAIGRARHRILLALGGQTFFFHTL